MSGYVVGNLTTSERLTYVGSLKYFCIELIPLPRRNAITQTACGNLCWREGY
jgi:hypothetical protein